MAQLPEDAEGVAIAILIYSVFCFFCNLLMIWLLWTSRQTFSHIGVICMFTCISITVNIMQQVNDNLFWEDIMWERFYHIKEHVGSPWLSASNGYIGFDFYLWLIRYTSQTIAAGLACFWALSLTQAVYGWTRGNWNLINNIGKVISVILPITFVCLCFVKPIEQSTILFYLFFDSLFILFIACGAVLLLMILIRYIKTGQELKEWDVEHSAGGSSTTFRSFRLSGDVSIVGIPISQYTGIYDKWLIIRFSIAFVFMILFVINIVVIQATGYQDTLHDSLAPAPDLGVFRAKRNLTLMMPGEVSGVLALVTFGTTKHFRETMYRTFVPKRWQRAQASPGAAGKDGLEFPSLASTHLNLVVPGGGMENGGGALGRRFGERGSWTRGVRGINKVIPLEDLQKPRPIGRDSVWRESTLSSIAEYT